ncbi:O-antigen ligase family protein [Roseomonas sp. NAR14]|uniref:O-antigen ligase family protein n=1 Tax=Roseomonas acroporae TaxID=2937791 RepID=A0A9X1YCI7_9PROT|nr:O-antigen ligase family protein [Roseomonas acroporae]MCK8786197.1 O-antigen ligase family protein [Roseomonas acroporae]
MNQSLAAYGAIRQPLPRTTLFPTAVGMGATIVFLFGIFLNEAFGPAALALAIGIHTLCFIYAPRNMLAALLPSGMLFVYLVPLMELSSAYWSMVPDLTVRNSIQVILTVALTLMLVNLVNARQFIRCLFFVMVVVALLSIAQNNYDMDGMTGRVNWTGIYHNKNTMSLIGYYLITTSLTILLSRREKLIMRLMCLGAMVGGMAICISARTVGMWICILASFCIIIAITWVGSMPRKYLTSTVEMVTVGAIVVGTALAIFVMQNAEFFLRLVNKDPTLTGRTLLWFHAARLVDNYPILGYGFSSFWVQGNPPAEDMWRLLSIPGRAGFSFHSLFWEFWITLGVVGLALIGYTLLRAVILIFRWIRVAPSATSGFYLASLVMVLITETQAVDLFGAFNGMYVLFIVSLGFARQQLRARRLDAGGQAQAGAPRLYVPTGLPTPRGTG